MEFAPGKAFALQADQDDVLKSFRNEFHLPVQGNGKPYIYMCGNSLGLQPKRTERFIKEELEDWARLGVEGHVHGRHPWMPYHEFLTEGMAMLTGAKSHEVVVMNTLSANLHFMMVSFYRPTSGRYKIMIESDAFPSDLYAVESQTAFHGFDPQDAVVKLYPREGEVTLRQEDILQAINTHKDELALILIGNVNYYTGQAFDIASITKAGHKAGALVGFDLAHGVGNLKLNLHDDGPDFAVWCTYKYLNSGPGSVAGCFVHERHADDANMPRFSGWWGHDKKTRFNMRHDFNPIHGAEGWQLSNPPILSLAAIRSSLEVFQEAGFDRLKAKSVNLTSYMAYLLDGLNNDSINIITPSDPAERGCQLSIQVRNADKALFDRITDAGVIADWREPDVIRVAPVPLYNSFEDVFDFVEIIKSQLS